jgi:hypothetical protein
VKNSWVPPGEVTGPKAEMKPRDMNSNDPSPDMMGKRVEEMSKFTTTIQTLNNRLIRLEKRAARSILVEAKCSAMHKFSI